jgi:hypothetical protein
MQIVKALFYWLRPYSSMPLRLLTSSLLLLFLCTATAPLSSTGLGLKLSPPELKIVLVLPELNKAEFVARMVLDDLKWKIQNRRVNLKLLDENLSRKQLVQDLEKLSPDLVVGFTRSDRLLQVYENTKFSIINTGASPGQLCDPSRLLSFMPSEALRAKAALKLGYGAQRPVVLASRNSNGLSAVSELPDLPVIWVPVRTTDYSQILMQIAAQHNDVVYVATDKQDTYALLSKAKYYFYKPQFISLTNSVPITWPSYRALDTYGSNLTTPSLTALRNDFYKKTGSYPTPDGVRIADALSMLDSSSSLDLLTLHDTSFSSSSGLIKFVGGIGVYDYYELQGTDGPATEVTLGNLLTKGVEPNACASR